MWQSTSYLCYWRVIGRWPHPRFVISNSRQRMCFGYCLWVCVCLCTRQATFRKIFNACWRESPMSLQFYCCCLPISYLLDQHRLIFLKNMITSDNTLLTVLAKLSQPQIIAFATKYGIVQRQSCSISDIKDMCLAHFLRLCCDFTFFIDWLLCSHRFF